MAMGWGATTGRNMHIDETKTASSVIARYKQRVGISYHADVNEVLVFVWLGKCENTLEII